MGPIPKCYIPNFLEIDPLVAEKIFEGFIPYVDMAAILVMFMRPRCRKQTFVSPTNRGSTQNLALIGKAVLENRFEHCGWTYSGRQNMGISSPSAL